MSSRCSIPFGGGGDALSVKIIGNNDVIRSVDVVGVDGQSISPGRSTAGARWVRAAGVKGRHRSKCSGRSADSGGRYAMEMRGERPSSRRRLAQKATSMIRSISAVMLGMLPVTRVLPPASISRQFPDTTNLRPAVV